ncbi:hypothetical protein BH23ACT9_BH23ACT9_05870 [soil metagenome]
MSSTSTAISVSAVSVFEIETKRRLGKLDAPDEIVAAVAAERFGLLPLDALAGAAAGALHWDHRDPFGHPVDGDPPGSGRRRPRLALDQVVLREPSLGPAAAS